MTKNKRGHFLIGRQKFVQNKNKPYEKYRYGSFSDRKNKRTYGQSAEYL